MKWKSFAGSEQLTDIFNIFCDSWVDRAERFSIAQFPVHDRVAPFFVHKKKGSSGRPRIHPSRVACVRRAGQVL